MSTDCPFFFKNPKKHFFVPLFFFETVIDFTRKYTCKVTGHAYSNPVPRPSSVKKVASPSDSPKDTYVNNPSSEWQVAKATSGNARERQKLCQGVFVCNINSKTKKEKTNGGRKESGFNLLFIFRCWFWKGYV